MCGEVCTGGGGDSLFSGVFTDELYRGGLQGSTWGVPVWWGLYRGGSLYGGV